MLKSKCIQVGIFTTISSIYPYYSFAASVGAKHYNTSAKQNKGIQELFLDLSKSKP